MVRLPVSGIQVELHQLTGAEDMLLLEPSADELETAVALAQRLASRSDGAAFDVAALPLSDLEALLLEQRRAVFGNSVRPQARCSGAECSTLIDVSFRVSDYLAHYRPRMPRMVELLKDEPGWFRLRGSQVSFRLVTVGDLLATQGLPNPEVELARRTVRPQEISKRELKRVQRAMEIISPPQSQELEGRCPECGTPVRFFFSPRSFVLRELQFEAAFLYEDVHLLATRYHWSEDKILSLPRARRSQYAELASRRGA
jgi:hypothetical protein